MAAATASQTLHLLDLPAEILLKVLGNLSAPDLRRTTLVASPLHRAVKENASLQYILQCFKHGVVDCYPLDRSFPLSSLDAHASSETEPWTVSQKLNRLLERERKLTSLATDEQVVQVQGPCPIYELQPGVFVRGSDFVPSPGSHSDRPTSLEVYSLPTSGNGKESQYNRPAEVGVHTLNFDIGPYLDLTLDPTQNLVCIIKRSPGSSDAPTEMEVDSDQEDAPESGEQQPTQPTAGPSGCPTPSQVSGKNATYEVHLFDMAGNRRTDLPSSCLGLDNIDYASHLMQAAMAAHVQPARFLLQISGDTLGVLVGGSEEGERDLIHCWNWRTGKDLCTMGYDHSANSHIPEFHFPSFILLSPTAFAITSLESSTATPAIEVFDFDNFSGWPGAVTPQRAAVFGLPSLNPRLLRLPVRLIFEFRPDPPSSASDTIWGFQGKPSSRPFATDPSRGLINLDVSIGDFSFSFHMLKELLMDELEEFREKEEYAPVRWEQWWGDCWVMDGAGERRQWVTHIHGYRFAQLTVKEPLDEDDEPLHTVHLYDFSPCRVHWDDLEPSSPDDWNPLPQGQGVIDSPVWEAPFRSALPGVKRLVGVFPESQAPAGVMLDEERIILTYNRPLSSDWEFRIKAM